MICYILNVIRSCENYSQLGTCENWVLYLFNHSIIDKDTYQELISFINMESNRL